ncbi:MAG: tetratricopeptide repeat protein [Deltaproteobacteria bacterium]|nr:tetratricopeptide repeat protein [Deltaproteobacteria bacterium]MBW2137710.1 tetratricopeptide repeat protein [Deltaproteobacteria bacterium]
MRVLTATGVILMLLLLVYRPVALGGTSYLQEGIRQYKEENYEEAVELLVKARMQEPRSSAAAFFLGLAYKQIIDYPRALKNLEDAVTLRPRIKEAVVELVDVAILLNELEVARQWIQVAETEGIYPAKMAFLRGLVLKKEGKNQDAIDSFQRSMILDPALSQAAEFQIALCYVAERKLEKAKERFQAAVQRDPKTGLADYARRYRDLVQERIFLERPVRMTLGLFGQYDTNMLLQPLDASLVSEPTDQQSSLATTTFRIDYVPLLESPWLFNAQYAYYGKFHRKNSTSHDTVSNGLYLAPGYNFGRYALNLAVNYNHSLVRRPSYKKYLQYLSIGPLFRVLLSHNSVLELFSGYVFQEYHEPPLMEAEDRDSDGLSVYASWIWSFMKGALFNLRYEYTEDRTDGINWENEGHRFSANLMVPLIPTLQFQASGEAYIQDYRHTHTVFGVTRKDKMYRGSLGITWDFRKNTSLVVQFSPSRSDSNIGIYDYEREVYAAGIEYRF